MRTRRQDKPAAGPAEPASTRSEERGTAPSSPTVYSITKVESPTVGVPVKSKGAAAAAAKSKLPAPVQFPLVVVLNIATSAILYSITHPYTKAVLAAHARSLDTWAELGALVGWKVIELGLGWFGNYDGYDLAALNLLSHGPPLYLLAAFYNTPPSALLLTLAIETFATYLPFRLLRPLSDAHRDPSQAHNADLLTDKPIQLLTSLLSGAIYTVTLFAAYATYLPTAMIVYFDSLPSIAAAHESTYVNLLPVTVTLGFAATFFIFTPAEAEENEKPRDFDPANASLKETVSWNFWGWSKRAKMIIKRTATIMIVTGVSTTLQTSLTVAGAETKGAMAWASVWVIAAAITGLGLGAVGSE
ncbi:hypothetical protein JX265_007534 [Neoarthrinium moseri]|uniref:Uncharacterized protein n=1 Tax=Neoarthrinium moseri TaxID=1658444 RepID=A0A9P9WJQ9_9PEZI|nr:uncharacterized protein JN550_000052 [Neoarthrinium moseri]KAI1866958.1 hypothetical protein JX265_007534 [Neoarthrinium moseri]KAI1877870.1 hypothetical protein JN550_000052 [Neoarthrinium moseri]